MRSNRRGDITNTNGLKTGERHEGLNDIELAYLYLMDWEVNVISYKEHISIPNIKGLAKKYGIKSPPKEAVTSFLVRINTDNGPALVARSLMYTWDKKPIDDKKIALQSLYWKEKNIPFEFITEDQLQSVEYFHNLSFFRQIDGFDRYKKYDENSIREIQIVEKYLKAFLEKNWVLSNACNQLDQQYGLEKGTSIRCYGFLVYNHYWVIDMEKKYNFEKIPQIIETRLFEGFPLKEKKILEFRDFHKPEIEKPKQPKLLRCEYEPSSRGDEDFVIIEVSEYNPSQFVEALKEFLPPNHNNSRIPFYIKKTSRPKALWKTNNDLILNKQSFHYLINWFSTGQLDNLTIHLPDADRAGYFELDLTDIKESVKVEELKNGNFEIVKRTYFNVLWCKKCGGLLTSKYENNDGDMKAECVSCNKEWSIVPMDNEEN